MFLRAEGIDNNDGGVGIVRLAHGLSNNNGGVSGGRGIYDASKVSETTAEAAGDRRGYKGIYNNDVGVGGGR